LVVASNDAPPTNFVYFTTKASNFSSMDSTSAIHLLRITPQYTGNSANQFFARPPVDARISRRLWRSTHGRQGCSNVKMDIINVMRIPLLFYYFPASWETLNTARWRKFPWINSILHQSLAAYNELIFHVCRIGCTTFRPGHSGLRLSGPLLLGLNVANVFKNIEWLECHSGPI
jgi:hypothetical protein